MRSLAADLGLAVNTVARAYRELETLGVIETRGRAGSVVSGAGVEQAARQAAHDYVERLRALGIGKAEAWLWCVQALDRELTRTAAVRRDSQTRSTPVRSTTASSRSIHRPTVAPVMGSPTRGPDASGPKTPDPGAAAA